MVVPVSVAMAGLTSISTDTAFAWSVYASPSLFWSTTWSRALRFTFQH